MAPRTIPFIASSTTTGIPSAIPKVKQSILTRTLLAIRNDAKAG